MTELRNLSEADASTLALITTTIDETGVGPTYQELADQLEISKSAIPYRLRNLRKYGYVAPASPEEHFRCIQPLFYADGTPFLSRQELLSKLQESYGQQQNLANLLQASLHKADVLSELIGQVQYVQNSPGCDA